ncbi:MAG: KOW domain-containing RNA-binding protein [Clostridia bacterium]|nr:KOW domain-containing RNA-binding protein [Clostridia bacterium]
MKQYPIEPGSVVLSRAGRDQGRLFLVLREIDEDFVEIVNGDLRGMERPKKKRRKHLKPTGSIIRDVPERIRQNATIENSEIRSWLKKEEERLVQI